MLIHTFYTFTCLIIWTGLTFQIPLNDGPDILGGPVNVHLRPPTTPQKHSLTRRSFGVKPKFAWPNGTIRYKFQSKEVENSIGKCIRNAAKEWKAFAPYLTFIELPASDKLSRDVVTVTADGKGPRSQVAMRPGESANAKFLNVDPSPSDKKSENYHCLHEWGHIIGLHHEHQRPDREQYITFACGNLLGKANGVDCSSINCCSKAKHDCCVNMLDKYAPVTNDDFQIYGDFDFDSLMLYPPNSDSKWFGKIFYYSKAELKRHPWRIFTVDYGLFGPNVAISAGDARTVCEIYHDLCYKCLPGGSSGKRVPGCSPTPRPGPAPSKPSGLVEKSGWKFAFIQSSVVSAWSDKSYFVPLSSGGPLSVNTRCLTVKEASGGYNDRIAKGDLMVWETRLDPLPGTSADSCCILVSAGTSCQDGGGVAFRKNCNGYNGNSPIEVRSFKVYGCTGLYVPNALRK